jgi:pterin-4a-carbinolamine dehydratase
MSLCETSRLEVFSSLAEWSSKGPCQLVNSSSNSLTSKNRFRSVNSLLLVVAELNQIYSAKHHSTSLHLDGEKRPSLTITTQTHDLEHPWLSLRDVSLASSLESIYRESAYGPTKGKSAVRPPYVFDAASWEKLLSEYPWNLERFRIEDNELVML